MELLLKSNRTSPFKVIQNLFLCITGNLDLLWIKGFGNEIMIYGVKQVVCSPEFEHKMQGHLFYQLNCIHKHADILLKKKVLFFQTYLSTLRHYSSLKDAIPKLSFLAIASNKSAPVYRVITFVKIIYAPVYSIKT